MTRVDDVLGLASAELGKPYVYGAEGPNSFDCSGLMQWVFAHIGITLPRTAASQQQATTPVTTPLPGDLVFYGAPATHVGLYLGGGKMINAPTVNSRVRIDSVGTPTGYGRVAGLGTAAAVPIAAVTAAASGLGDATSAILGGAQHIVLEGAVVALGLALVGYGLWRTSAGTRTRAKSALHDVTGGII